MKEHHKQNPTEAGFGWKETLSNGVNDIDADGIAKTLIAVRITDAFRPMIREALNRQVEIGKRCGINVGDVAIVPVFRELPLVDTDDVFIYLRKTNTLGAVSDAELNAIDA